VPDGYVYVAWSSSGDRVFLTGGSERRAVVTYRLGALRARRLRVHGGQFHGVAAG
jgi:hypothetical protein